MRIVKQAVLQLYRTRIIYKYEIQVPRNHKETMDIDARNCITLWREAKLKELEQLDNYKVLRIKAFQLI